MPREYRHISQYEQEILALKASGLTYREIGEKLGFTRNQVDEFLRRYFVYLICCYACGIITSTNLYFKRHQNEH